jgi:hypothetical protein
VGVVNDEHQRLALGEVRDKPEQAVQRRRRLSTCRRVPVGTRLPQHRHRQARRAGQE